MKMSYRDEDMDRMDSRSRGETPRRGGLTFGKGFLIFVVVCVFACLGVGGCTYSTYVTMTRDENGIIAQESIIDLTMSKMEQKITGKGFVLNNWKETSLEILHATVGKEGRRAGTFFNAVSEAYPEVPQELWLDMADTMDAEIEDMFAAQASKVSRIQSFDNHLDDPRYLLAKNIGGFPRKVDMEEARKLILTKGAREARETGEIEVKDPFKKEDQKPNQAENE